MKSVDNFFKKNGFVGGVTIVVIVVAIIVILWNKLVSRKSGKENMDSKMMWYGNQNTSQPQNVQKKKPQTSNDLLPKDTNSEWAQLNPTGLGELSNINLLKSGWQVGVDTMGQSLRNANLQLRSEPPNPQTPVGPWNQSTITPDFMRVPLEIGQGTQ
jgi:hypothetical protein